jgi:hypothetical protein
MLSAGLSLLTWGCNAPRLQPRIDADQPAQRVPAFIDAAQQPDAQTTVQLIEALDDDDPAVRAFAAESLERATGQDFGYRFYQAPQHRSSAIERWRQWHQQQHTPTAASDE